MLLIFYPSFIFHAKEVGKKSKETSYHPGAASFPKTKYRRRETITHQRKRWREGNRYWSLVTFKELRWKLCWRARGRLPWLWLRATSSTHTFFHLVLLSA